MTGEDTIIVAAAKLLREAALDEHLELRRAFWLGGRCEHCGAPHDGDTRCSICKRLIINRDTS